MRRIALFLTALLLLLAGGLFIWQASGCRIVAGKLCTDHTQRLDLSGRPFRDGEKLAAMKTLTELDLRDTGLTAEEFEALQAALPQCSIAWDVPFQGAFYPEDTTHLTVSVLAEEDIRMLAYFTQLESIDATGCRDLAAVRRLLEACPGCRIDYVVPLNGRLLTPEIQSLTLGADSIQALSQALALLPYVREVDATQSRDYAGLRTLQQQYPQVRIRCAVSLSGQTVDDTVTELRVQDPDLRELKTALEFFPGLQTLQLSGQLPDNVQLHALQQQYPHVRIDWKFTLCGITVSTLDQTLDLSDIPVGSTDEIEQALPYFYDLQTVDMCDCGISSQDMAAMAQRHPQVRFIWKVQIGRSIRIRTDATYLMPFQYGVTLTDADTAELKYCVDMLCLDLGHSQITNVSFLAYMPKLQYLTLGETPVRDISPMAGLQELVFAELFLTNVQDYSPLLSCPKLQDLNISYAIPKDMTVLCQLKQVKHLHLKGLWQEDWQQQLRQALPDTTLVFAGTGDISSTGDGWRSLENYYKMRDILGMPYMSY